MVASVKWWYVLPSGFILGPTKVQMLVWTLPRHTGAFVGGVPAKNTIDKEESRGDIIVEGYSGDSNIPISEVASHHVNGAVVAVDT
jgi:hypothetical protein